MYIQVSRCFKTTGSDRSVHSILSGSDDQLKYFDKENSKALLRNHIILGRLKYILN